MDGADFHRNRHRRNGWQNECVECRSVHKKASWKALIGERMMENYAMSLKEVGEELNITAERVRQIEVTALRKLAANAHVMRAVRHLLEGRE